MNATNQQNFDYTQLQPNTANLAQGAANRIKTRAKTTAQDAVEIGQDLAAVKAALPHGHWGPWLQSEFGWSHRTAQRYIRIWKIFKNDKLADLNIALSALHLLAVSEIDDATRQTALEIAREAGSLKHAQTQALITNLPDSTGRINSGYHEFESALPLGHIKIERTTKTITTDTIEIELPEHLQKPLYIDPLQIFHQTARLEQAIAQLLEIYRLSTGRTYQLISNLQSPDQEIIK